jgi:hypothetical protein
VRRCDEKCRQGRESGRRPLPREQEWNYREIFIQADIPLIEAAVRHPLVAGNPRRKRPGKALVEALNAAAGDYFKYADDEGVGTPSEFARWAQDVSKAGAGLLLALGVDPAKQGPVPPSAFRALCERPDRPLTAADYGVQNHATTLEAVAHGAAFIRDLGEQAARYTVRARCR